MALKHAFQSTFADNADTTKLRPSNWGSDFTNYTTTPTHVFSGGALGSMLCRDTGTADGSTWLAPPVIDVKLYGAVGNGVADDTSAIQAAITALSSTGGVVFVPSGQYKITSQLTISNGVQLVGASQLTSVLVFAPSGAATLIRGFTTSNLSYSGGVRDLRLYAQDTTNTKVAIEIVDGDNWLIDRVVITGATSAGGTSYWGGNGSIGIRTKGRNDCTFRSLVVGADKPIVIADNPNSVIDIDHFHFQDLILVGNGNPLITVEDGVNLTHVSFDGYQSWVKGTAGLYWHDTTTTQVGVSLTLRNIRHEQAESATGYIVDIAHNQRLHGLKIDGLYGGLNCRGIKLRNVNWATIQNYEYLDTSREALNIDNTVDPIVLINSWAQTGSTVSLSSVVKQFEIAANSGASQVGNSALPMFGIYGAGVALRNVGPATVPAHADNAAAVSAGLVNGDLYRTGDTVKVVHA